MTGRLDVNFLSILYQDRAGRGEAGSRIFPLRILCRLVNFVSHLKVGKMMGDNSPE